MGLGLIKLQHILIFKFNLKMKYPKTFYIKLKVVGSSKEKIMKNLT